MAVVGGIMCGMVIVNVVWTWLLCRWLKRLDSQMESSVIAANRANEYQRSIEHLESEIGAVHEKMNGFVQARRSMPAASSRMTSMKFLSDIQRANEEAWRAAQHKTE